MRILSIETSCDDTSIAIVEATGKASKTAAPTFIVHENIVSSQTATHRQWGGVVPNLAKREHIKNLPKIYHTLTKEHSDILENVGMSSRINLIAVTVGPGLEPALWAGIEFAKKLSEKLNVPLVGANHLEGHLYSFLLPRSNVNGQMSNVGIAFPAVALLVSGGHTMLLHMKDLLHWKLLGETRDDAVGEAFDKVARMLGLPYPGGPEIEKLAKKGNPKAITFPRPMMREENYDFSFSGLKTAVLYYIKKSFPRESALSPRKSAAADIAAAFQSATIDVLVTKAIRAVREFGAQSVILCGGVAANTALRETLARAAGIAGATFIAPEKEYNTDNAAMIAAAAYINTFRKKKYPMEANGNLSL
ncbi:MAG: tRNA (adenosine(37)-N6)-threonylcarbamoyltransferase complex transferase subunit TsaD [bacterium]|nr:tRNA (adenosine(37)-N6)-threonylcarbamoyltransferase complex transferase subunit TsaD [bacterium]